MASVISTIRGLTSAAAPRNPANTATMRTFFSAQPFGLRTAGRRPISTFYFSANSPRSALRPTNPLSKLRFQPLRSRFFHSSRPRRTAGAAEANAAKEAPKAPLTLGQRMKKLSREYGWSALGVYLALSALDFPLCYLLVHWLGTDRVGRWEHAVVSRVAPLIPVVVKERWFALKAWMHSAEEEITGSDDLSDVVDMAGWGVEEAQRENKKEASLATQLALAYAIHKSFIFLRVPATVGLTPKVVKLLRGWGWNIGKRSTEAEKAARKTMKVAKKEAKVAKKEAKVAKATKVVKE
ncbi:hypothetical protein V496_08447 [Pseudogymnoascus sp. VKM F-4515 (FW-2607)]|nr:hypothetical protein V496_08447 [Pseudogymnoascus sp. VKM F-4515 (FW-2607)]